MEGDAHYMYDAVIPNIQNRPLRCYFNTIEQAKAFIRERIKGNPFYYTLPASIVEFVGHEYGRNIHYNPSGKEWSYTPGKKLVPVE